MVSLEAESKSKSEDGSHEQTVKVYARVRPNPTNEACQGSGLGLAYLELRHYGWIWDECFCFNEFFELLVPEIPASDTFLFSNSHLPIISC